MTLVLRDARRLVTGCILVTGVITYSPSVLSQSCDFLPSAAQPEWTYDAPDIEGFYVGVGLAEADGLGADEQIEQAKQSAVNDLAGSIKISVRSSLTVNTRQQTAAGRSITEQDVSQMTATVVDTSLRDVKVDSTWLDRKRCIVWVRVKIARTTVAAMEQRELNLARLNQLDAHYNQAGNSALSPEQRDTALKQAYVLLDEINFEAIKGKHSRRYYQRLLDSVASRVGKQVGSQQQAETLRQEAEQLLLRAGSAAQPDERKQLRLEAIGKLKQIIAANPLGEREDFHAAEAAAFKIAEIEKARNNPCEAQFQYEIVRDRSRSDEWVSKAGEMLAAVQCTRKNKTTHSWRRAFDGVRTSFICASDIKGEINAWDKPCENLESFVKGYGALSGVDVGLAPDAVVKLAYNLDQNSQAASLLKDKGRVLLFVATGEVKHRDNKNNPMGQDHQFSGRIYSYILNNGKLDFKDSYTGTGGWNPVSQAMTMEVLGLNVAKRWKSKYYNHIKNN